MGGSRSAGAGAIAVQANSTWLVSGATLILNFLKKAMPRMGPATAACKKLAVKSLPMNWTVSETNPQEGMGCLSAPFRRGPDVRAYDEQGTILRVAPVSTKYLLFTGSSVKKIKPAFAGYGCGVFVFHRRTGKGSVAFQFPAKAQ